MGRYSSVQSYADNSGNVRSLTYDQAKGKGTNTSSDGAAPVSASTGNKFIPPEKVVNAYGSTAGAGSGEFHVYRQARSREMERIKTMEKSKEEAEQEDAYSDLVAQNQAESEQKTAKNRKKRQREKEAKQRKRNLAKLGVKPTEAQAARLDDHGVDEDEFSYVPLAQRADEGKKDSNQEKETVQNGNGDVVSGDDEEAAAAEMQTKAEEDVGDNHGPQADKEEGPIAKKPKS